MPFCSRSASDSSLNFMLGAHRSYGGSASRSSSRIKTLLTQSIVSAVLATFTLYGGAEGLPELGDSSDAVVTAPQERAIGKRIMIEIRGDNAFIDDIHANQRR